MMTFRNQEYYEKVRVSANESTKPFFNKFNWPPYIIALILAIAAAPFLTIKKSHIVPSSLDIYFHQVKFFACATALIILPLLWVMQFKPYFEMKSGHYYVGKFEVKKKIQILGHCYLLLLPGNRNWIKVSQKIFHSIRVGEIIELKRATFGSINGIRKICDLRRRIKDAYLSGRENDLLNHFQKHNHGFIGNRGPLT